MTAKRPQFNRRLFFVLALAFPIASGCVFFESPAPDAAPRPSAEISPARDLPMPTPTAEPSPTPAWPYPVIDPSNAGHLSQVSRFGYGRLVVRLAGLPGGDVLQDFKGADSYRLAFSPDSKALSSGCVVWDTATGEERLVRDQNKQTAYAVAFSPDGAILAVGNENNEVLLVDAMTGERLAALTGHTDRISDVAFTPDGRVLFSGSVDGTVRLWAVAA